MDDSARILREALARGATVELTEDEREAATLEALAAASDLLLLVELAWQGTDLARLAQDHAAAIRAPILIAAQWMRQGITLEQLAEMGPDAPEGGA